MESIERPLINPTTGIKNGTIPYIYTSKHLHLKESWQQLYNQLEESDYNQVIIRFTEDDTAFLINKCGFFVYGTFDKNTNFIGDSISDYWQDFPDFILLKY